MYPNLLISWFAIYLDTVAKSPKSVQELRGITQTY